MVTSKNNKNVARIFTDGACSGNPGVGGWASIILTDSKVKKISGHELETTNNRMELIAVISGLECAIKHGFKRVQIYSDSAYVVNAIAKGWIYVWRASHWKKSDDTEVKNSDLWKKMYKLIQDSSFKEIEFNKVKGHSGNHFNEMADSLAKEEVLKGRAEANGTRN